MKHFNITPFTEFDKFNWLETYMIDEVPSNDVWDNYATVSKLELEDQYRKMKMPKECSKHYMAIRPELTGSLAEVLDHFKDKVYNYNFLKLTPGYNIWWHYDSYSTFVKFNDISEEDSNNIHRTAIMVTPWAPGQVLQIEDKIYSHWDIGDAFTWKGKEWHGASNFGFEDFIVMQVSWI